VRVLWLSFSDMTSEPWIESLASLNHDLEVIRYDRLRIPCDVQLLNAADERRPDVILYSGMAGGPHIPCADTLRRLRGIAPVVLISGDLCDPPWWPYLEQYREQKACDLVVNIDGNHFWPHYEGSSMKVLWLAPSDMTTEATISSLAGYDTTIYRYDKGPIPPDREMLNTASQAAPDVILHLGQNGGPFMASERALRYLKDIAPSVELVFDGSDTTWLKLLTEYRDNDTFSLTVNIDGNADWPGSQRGLTLLTPVPARHYRDLPGLLGRPVTFGFAGGYSSRSRREIIEHLVANAGLSIPRRNEQYGSYAHYANFLKQTKIVLNMPWSGSDNAVQVKGRVLEAGHAGCVLLEHKDSAARHWFNAGIDYAVYDSKEHAVEQVKALLADPDWMEQLAHALHTRVTTEHSAAVFWSKVFGAISQ